MDIPAHVSRALDMLEAAGYESYAVGGCVRDKLLKIEPHDWDLCTAALPEEVQRVFASERIITTGIKHGTVTLLSDNHPLEITTFRREGGYSDCRRPDRVDFIDDIHEDLRRRDFTVNAMAYSPRRGLRDDFGGERDLRAGIIRCVGTPEERLREDALRILRALRFAARFGFEIEENTAAALIAEREGLKMISAERIYAELTGILTGEHAGDVLRAFPEIVFTVIPELRAEYGFDHHRPEAHRWDVWEHTLHALDASERESILRWTMLLHDIAKPACFRLDEAGIGRFRDHTAAGRPMAEAVLGRLRADNRTRETVGMLIENHDVFWELNRKRLRRMLASHGDEKLRLLLRVFRADARAHTETVCEERLGTIGEVEAMLEDILAEKPCLSVKELAVGGRELIASGFKPGEALGNILNTLFAEVLDEKLPNERQALLERAEELRKEQ